MIQVEPGHTVHHFEGRRQGGHQFSEGRNSHCKVISIRARNRLERAWGGRVPWDDGVLEPTKDGIERHCKQEAACRAALSHATGQHQGSRFNLEDVIHHLPGRDASLRWMKTSHCVPLKASANRCGKNLAITLHRVDGRSASGDLTIKPLLSTSEDLGIQNSSARGKLHRNWATHNHMFVRIVLELRTQPSSTSVETFWNPIGTWSGFLLWP